MEPTNSKQRATYHRLFAQPIPNDILWDDILSLLRHLGYTIEPRGGSLFRFRKGTARGIIMHRPHPSSQTSIAAIKELRAFLERNGDAP